MKLLLLLLMAAPAPKELRLAMPGDPRTFDALQASDIHSETVRYLTSGVLVRVNRVTDELQPELAQSWQLTDGGKAITFHLRPGLQFSDGAPLTTADVARTIRRALDPKEASPVADVLGSPEIVVGSPLDITLRYKAVRAGLDRIFDGVSVVSASAAKLPPTAGPYFVFQYRPGEFVRLLRNPHYWKKDSAKHQLPYIDSIRIDIQQNHDIELSRFLRRDLDLISVLQPDNFARLQADNPAAAKNLGASLDSEFLWFNQSPAKTVPEWKRKWFTSTAFRQAVSGAIHRDDLVRVAYRGFAAPAAGPVSTANRFWFNSSLKAPAADAKASLKLLAGAGFVLQNGVLKDHDGHAVEFSLVTNSGNRGREKMGPMIQDDLKAIGIKVNFVPLEFGSLIERMTKSLDYEAVLLGFQNVESDPNSEMNVWLSSGAQHPWWPAEKTPATPWEARIDELEKKQAAETTRAERKKAVDELQQIVVEQAPVIYLVNPNRLAAISPTVHGVQPGPSPPQVLWNVEWLRLD